jgi:flotillin
VQTELDQFGLHIYNANIKQLMDAPGSEYFLYMRMKTHEGAVNQAKIDVAQAKYVGNVGEKEREGLTRQNVARVDAETIIYENERKATMANAAAQLAIREAEYQQQAEVAAIEAKRNAEMRDAELLKDVEERRAMAETEKLRAQLVAKATAECEAAMQEANAKLYARQKEAEAELFAKAKEAEGVRMLLEAKAAGLRMMVEAFNGDMAAFQNYLMIDRGIYQELARQNAEAIRGLEPKITVWNTGAESTDGRSPSGGAMQPIADIFRTLPPLFTTIQDQTGVTPFPWMAATKQNNAQ